MRSFYSTIYNVLVRVLFGVRVRDVNFAFKLCRRSVLDHMTLVSEGSFIGEAGHPGQQAGLQHRPVRCRLLPATRGVST